MNEFRIQQKLMGTAFELLVVEEDPARAMKLLDIGIEEIKRLERLLSEFIPESYTCRINSSAGIQPVIVNNEIFGLLERCQQISSISGGSFDITVGPLKKLYNFKNSYIDFPEKKTIKKTLRETGYHNLRLSKEESSVFLARKAMHISFAAIGKGFAADCVKKIWLEMGLKSGFINASGDLTAFGTKVDGSPWKMGIANPDNPRENLYAIQISSASIATSGDYEQYFIYKGKRYSHNIHPKTGLPLQGIKSVSVVSPSAELSDALATAVYVMGAKNGINFIDQLPDTHCIVITEDNKHYFSKNLDLMNKYEN
jgi:thiamine biosynthesis lipoprotein